MFSPADCARKTFWFGIYALACSLAFWVPLRDLIRLASGSDPYSILPVVPVFSVALLWMERRRLFATLERSTLPAVAVGTAGAAVGTLAWRIAAAPHSHGALFLGILGYLLVIWAGFLFFYGKTAFRAGLFPLLFLSLMLPIPGRLLDGFIGWLQVGSADVAEWIFHLTGIPVERHGLILAVPHVTIEVAKSCSGIRSTEALLITSLLAGYLFLRTKSGRVALLVAAAPVLVIKNGIRIATLVLLAEYVNPSFLFGSLHHQGGFVFFALGLLILLPLLLWLQRAEARRLQHGGPSSRAAVSEQAGVS